MFSKLPEINRRLILEQMSAPSPVETISTSDVVSDITTPEVVTMEASTTVPTTPRSPRPKHTLTRETQLAKSK